jgi:hypothetical protein
VSFSFPLHTTSLSVNAVTIAHLQEIILPLPLSPSGSSFAGISHGQLINQLAKKFRESSGFGFRGCFCISYKPWNSLIAFPHPRSTMASPVPVFPSPHFYNNLYDINKPVDASSPSALFVNATLNQTIHNHEPKKQANGRLKSCTACPENQNH